MARHKKRSKAAFDDHEAFSIEETNAVLKFFRLDQDDFSDWMYGQTCPMIKGKIAIYYYDLRRYAEWKVLGRKPIFD